MRTALTKVPCGSLDSVASTCDAPGRRDAQFGKPCSSYISKNRSSERSSSGSGRGFRNSGRRRPAAYDTSYVPTRAPATHIQRELCQAARGGGAGGGRSVGLGNAEAGRTRDRGDRFGKSCLCIAYIPQGGGTVEEPARRDVR
ncbi:hypothetical protein EVAR_87357_1 [Eumeta japonica]|uniref:Uncharacterized protein n=1 Tax=Eumeta variegata TaxID=151549 RepID=A0A4C1YWG1_EUMVA|nr:hypothetical protein EVAR_87357_1 [Eumeta japonica]